MEDLKERRAQAKDIETCSVTSDDLISPRELLDQSDCSSMDSNVSYFRKRFVTDCKPLLEGKVKDETGKRRKIAETVTAGAVPATPSRIPGVSQLDIERESQLLERSMQYIDEMPNRATSPCVTDIDSNSVMHPEHQNIDIYTKDTDLKWYQVNSKMVTKPIAASKLVDAFQYLPVHGKPDSVANLKQFQQNKIREFVGGDLNDEQFNKLMNYCSPEHLKIGKELKLQPSNQYQGSLPRETLLDIIEHNQKEAELCVVKKFKMRMENDPSNVYSTKLKYRGLRLIPLTAVEEEVEPNQQYLEPGKDLLYRIRIYRPFHYLSKNTNKRHSVFSRDLVISGRQSLQTLRDNFFCSNDLDLRVDCSNSPRPPLQTTCAKNLFPSGFLFINNVFYVDQRAGCKDFSAPIRAWAKERGMGEFQYRDLDVALEDICVKLGHPEVYMHQGNCEHLFVFSEIRLVKASDPLRLSHYPCHTALSQNQSIYCTSCAEFAAKWIVTGCSVVPFDPAFFCEPCLKMYLYKGEKKIGDFKSYMYMGNENNMLNLQS